MVYRVFVKGILSTTSTTQLHQALQTQGLGQGLQDVRIPRKGHVVNMATTTYCFLTYETLEQCTFVVNSLNGNWLGDVATSRLSATLAKDRDNQTYPKARFGPGSDQTGCGVVLREAGRGNGAPDVPAGEVAVAEGVPEAAVAEPNSAEAVPTQPPSAEAAVAEPAAPEAAVAEPAAPEAASRTCRPRSSCSRTCQYQNRSSTT